VSSAEAMPIHEKRAHPAQSLPDHDLETTLTFRWRPTSDGKHHWNAHWGGAHMLAPKKANLSEPLMREKNRAGADHVLELRVFQEKFGVYCMRLAQWNVRFPDPERAIQSRRQARRTTG
jgi:hypothetical protein